MESSTVGATVLHERPSAFDPDREIKDRKLTQIFKKLHMEQDLNTLLDLDSTVPRPSKVDLNREEESNKDKAERCRPRKILDYAVLAKGEGYRNNLVGSFASRCLDADGSSKSGTGYKRIRFKKDQSEDGIPTFDVKRRSRLGGNASVSKKSNKSRRLSLSLAANIVRKKEKSRSESFSCGTKGGILKRRMKDANNIKQAFLISKEVLNARNQRFEEFVLPEKWIKESQKRRKVKKVKSKQEEKSSGASVEDLAMERLVRAFKTAKLLYPEKFAEYFPDFIHCFESDDNKRKGDTENGVMSKQMYLKTIKTEEDAVTLDKNIASDSGEDQPKRIRKMPKVLREYSTDTLTRKKLASSQKINGPSGIYKKSKTTDSPSHQSIHSKSQQNGKAGNIKDMRDSDEVGSALTSKKRKCTKSVFHPNASAKATSVNAAVVQNNIEDSATESSSDESGNMRLSKRQRAQSGFYKTMLTLYDKKRS